MPACHPCTRDPSAPWGAQTGHWLRCILFSRPGSKVVPEPNNTTERHHTYELNCTSGGQGTNRVLSEVYDWLWYGYVRTPAFAPGSGKEWTRQTTGCLTDELRAQQDSPGVCDRPATVLRYAVRLLHAFSSRASSKSPSRGSLEPRVERCTSSRECRAWNQTGKGDAGTANCKPQNSPWCASSPMHAAKGSSHGTPHSALSCALLCETKFGDTKLTTAGRLGESRRPQAASRALVLQQSPALPRMLPTRWCSRTWPDVTGGRPAFAHSAGTHGGLSGVCSATHGASLTLWSERSTAPASNPWYLGIPGGQGGHRGHRCTTSTDYFATRLRAFQQPGTEYALQQSLQSHTVHGYA